LPDGYLEEMQKRLEEAKNKPPPEKSYKIII